MTTDVINDVPRELLERIALPMERDSAYLFQHRDDLDELRALLATAQPADHSEHDLNMVSQPAADEDDEYMPAGIVESIEHSTEMDCVGMARDALAACVSQPAADGEREAFEAWQIDSGRTDEQWFSSGWFGSSWFDEDEGKYALDLVQRDWQIWQEIRAAQPQQAVAVTDAMVLAARGVCVSFRGHYGEHNDYLDDCTARQIIEAALSVHKTGEEE